jgi:hypothetical protein
MQKQLIIFSSDIERAKFHIQLRKAKCINVDDKEKMRNDYICKKIKVTNLETRP